MVINSESSNIAKILTWLSCDFVGDAGKFGKKVQSNFFPAKFFFCILEKGNFDGKKFTLQIYFAKKVFYF
jgi:hypothetical protein